MNLQSITTATPQESDDELRALALAEVQAQGRIFDYVQFYGIVGNADDPRKEDADGATGESRAIGTSSTEYTARESDPTFGAVSLKTHGFEVKTDTAYQRRGGDIGSQRAKDLRRRSGEFARYLTEQIINGSGSGNNLKGYKTLAAANSGALEVAMGGAANGFELTAGNAAADRKAQAAVIEQIDALIELVDPTVIICNGTLIARLGSIGLNSVKTVTAKDIYGKDQQITTFRERPLLNAGYTSARNGLVIGNAETQGTSSDCTSMYFVRCGEREAVTIAGNNGINVQNLGQVGSKLVTRLEIDLDQTILDNYALRRLKGIRITNA